MAYQSVGLGSSDDDGGGDTLRSGGTKINANFLELYTLLGDGSTLTSGISTSGSQVTLTTPIIAEIDSSSTITLDATTDIVLDADGGDIFFKDGGTTFGSANNNSGNLTVKSGTTTALTFSGANVTVAGTLASGAITSSGVVTGSGFTIGSAVITEAELEMLDGITAGTAAASKALVLDSSTNITGIGTISSGAITSSGTITASGFTVGSAAINEAELEALDVTAGTATASKALVLDSSKDIGTIRNLTIDGTFSDGNYTFDTSGNVSGLGTVASGAITSTGVVTGTGFTAGSAIITEAELEMLDGITAGTATASKALVLDSSKDIGTIRNLTIDGTFSDGNYTFDTSGNVSGLGTIASGAITSSGTITATGFTIGSAIITEAELEMLDGISAGTAAASKAVVLNSSKNITGIGTIGSGDITSSGVVTATGFTIGSAVINEVKLEALDVAAGTATASKALVLDSSKDIGTIRNLTINGVFTDGNYTFDSSGNVSGLGTIASGAITSSGVVTGTGFTAGSAVIAEAELEMLDGITAGTAAASKAVVLDSSTNITGIGTIGSGAITSTGVVTATGFTIGSAVIAESELETLDGITAGTAAASKALVLNSSKDIGTIRNLTIDGVFSDGNYTFDTSGNVSGLGTISSGAITSSGVVTATGFTIGSAIITEAELEMLDGITAGTAAASKALVLNSSTNITGIGTISSGAITSSGVVTAGGFTIGSASINEAQLEVLDDVTAGTAAASKALVLDSSKDIGTIRNLTIDGTFSDGNYTFDSSGNVSGLGTVASGAITSTGVVTGTGFTIGSAVINEAELEQIDGITAGTVSASKAVVVDSNSNITGFGTIGSGAITSSGVVTATGFTIGSAVINETELETLDGITAGTAAGSKAVVLDSNKDIGTLRNITLSGELDAGSLDISGNADIDGTLEADAITVNGTTLAEYIADTTGAMVTSNTETGITVIYQDGDNTLDFALGAAQTTITSLLATDIKIGEDDQTKVDFETADEIHFYAANAEQVYVADGIFGPQTDSDVDLGTTGVRWKDAYVDTLTTTGAITAAGLVTAGSLNLGDDTVTTLKSGTYTPTWAAASGTAPAIGNGSLTGRYTQIGSLCHVLIKIYFGSSSTFGNGGVLRFGLPFTAATISGMAHVGSGSYIINDSGTGTTGGTVELGSALAYITLNCNPSGTVGATLATNAVPLTWATGDSLTVECLYEV